MGLVECLKRFDFVKLIDKSKAYKENQELKAQRNEKLLREIELEHKAFMIIYEEIKQDRKGFKEKLDLEFNEKYRELEKVSFAQLTEELNEVRKELSINLRKVDYEIEFNNIER